MFKTWKQKKQKKITLKSKHTCIRLYLEIFSFSVIKIAKIKSQRVNSVLCHLASFERHHTCEY